MKGFFAGSALQSTAAPGFERGLPKCGSCGFATKCRSPRFPVAGRGKLPVLLVKEHPSEAEDDAGRAYSGATDTLLREVLLELGYKLSDFHLTYAMICRPTGEWSDKNIAACRPALLTNVDEVKPRVVIALGPAAVRSLVPAERGGAVGAHERWVGWKIPSTQLGAWLCPTWSAQQVLALGKRDDPAPRLLWKDHLRTALLLLDREPRGMTLDDVWRRVEPIRSPRLAVKRLRDLARQEGALAFDYESNSRKPDREGCKLYAASFCLDGGDAFSVLLKDPEVLEALRPVLRSRKLRKTASNLKHEERWSMRFFGRGVAGWEWDTMQAAHVLDNRSGVTSIKFQSYVRLGVPDYDRYVEPFWDEGPDGFNRIHELDEGDLLRYNGADSLLEYLVRCEQRRELGYAG